MQTVNGRQRRDRRNLNLLIAQWLWIISLKHGPATAAGIGGCSTISSTCSICSSSGPDSGRLGCPMRCDLCPCAALAASDPMGFRAGLRHDWNADSAMSGDGSNHVLIIFIESPEPQPQSKIISRLINSAKGLALAEPSRKPDSRQKLKISAT